MKLIKKIGTVALGVGVAALIAGCGGEQPKPAEPAGGACVLPGNISAPEWVCSPKVEGAIAAVGVAEKTAAGLDMQTTAAMASARDKLARQIEVKVKNKFENFVRSTGTGQNETVDKVMTNVSKQVANVTLNGSKRVKTWFDPSGTMYVLVAVPESTINEAAKSKFKQAAKTSFKNDEALWQQFQSKQALDSLDKEFPTN